MRAVVLAAGRGTRMAAVTGGRAKEMLRVGSASVLRRVLDEALAAGAEPVVVTSTAKPEVMDACAEWRVPLVLQIFPNGVVDAFLTAEPNGPCLVLLGDCAFLDGGPSAGMAAALREGADGAIATEGTDDEGTRRYGVVEDEGGWITRVLEKPGPGGSPSRRAVAARYALSGALVEWARARAAQGLAPDFPLTTLLGEAVAAGWRLKAVPTGAPRADAGTPEEFAEGKALAWD